MLLTSYLETLHLHEMLIWDLRGLQALDNCYRKLDLNTKRYKTISYIFFLYPIIDTWYACPEYMLSEWRW